jgi:hypothetical protein
MTDGCITSGTDVEITVKVVLQGIAATLVSRSFDCHL